MSVLALLFCTGISLGKGEGTDSADKKAYPEPVTWKGKVDANAKTLKGGPGWAVEVEVRRK